MSEDAVIMHARDNSLHALCSPRALLKAYDPLLGYTPNLPSVLHQHGQNTVSVFLITFLLQRNWAMSVAMSVLSCAVETGSVPAIHK